LFSIWLPFCTEVLEILREEKVVTGWRNELYPVTSEFRKEPVLLLERAAAVQFGIKVGQHNHPTFE
jgi:hypothetical protein